MKTLEDERYVVIKAYKCTVSEIWRDSFVLAYIACTSYPYIATESTDSVIIACSYQSLKLHNYDCPLLLTRTACIGEFSVC